jgi:uncharacterized protein YsxB (DUF464 family)
LIDSFYQGVEKGFLNFVDYFLKEQGLSELTSLSEQDMEIFIDLLVSTLNDEIDKFIFNTTEMNSPFFEKYNHTNNNETLKEKITHLTENLMYLISIEFRMIIKASAKSSLSDSNQTTSSQIICDSVSNLVLNTLNIVEQNLGFKTQFSSLNNALSVVLTDLIAQYIFNEKCNVNNETVMRSLVNSYVSDQVNEVTNQIINSAETLLKDNKRSVSYEDNTNKSINTLTRLILKNIK